MQRSTGVVIVVAALAACGGKGDDNASGGGGGGKTTTKTYKGFEIGQRVPNGLDFEVTFPSAWAEEVDSDGTPSYKPPGAVLPLVSLVVHACDKDAADADACLTKKLEDRMDEHLVPGTPERNGDRLWAVYRTAPGDKSRAARTVATLLTYHAASRAVLECFGVILDDPAQSLPAVKRVCDSVALK